MSKKIIITLTDEEYEQIKKEAESNYRTIAGELKYNTFRTQIYIPYPYIPQTPTPENPIGEHIITNKINSIYDKIDKIDKL